MNALRVETCMLYMYFKETSLISHASLESSNKESINQYLVRPSPVYIKLDHRWRPIGFRGYWLIIFVVDHRWTFRAIIDIAIDSIHIGRRIFSVWITAVPGVHNPEYIGICMHVRHATWSPGTGFQNIKTPGSSAENAGQNMGL